MQGALPSWVSYAVYSVIAAAGVSILAAILWPRRP
jgi:hypothetical protein